MQEEMCKLLGIPDKQESDDYKCPDCQKEFKYPRSLERHIKSYHQTVRFTCSECLRQFDKKEHLKNHILLMHECHECEECDENFTSKTGLQKHVKKEHTKEQPPLRAVEH